MQSACPFCTFSQPHKRGAVKNKSFFTALFTFTSKAPVLLRTGALLKILN